MALSHSSQGWTVNSLFLFLSLSITDMPSLESVCSGFTISNLYQTGHHPMHVVYYCMAHLCKAFQFFDFLSSNTICLLFSLASRFDENVLQSTQNL